MEIEKDISDHMEKLFVGFEVVVNGFWLDFLTFRSSTHYHQKT
jgi:hypothetical protein